MSEQLTRIEKELLSPAKLKEYAKGVNGEFVTLVDIEQTKIILKELAEKYKGLKIDRSNYKKEGAEAEKELRQTRYALQNIHKGNNDILNKVKKAEKETFDELIEITRGVEDAIKKQLDAVKEIVKKEKEAEKRAEEERVAKIEKALRETEFALEKSIAKAKTKEDLKEYDDFLSDLEERFSEFQDFEFKAKRLHAVYQGRRSEVEKQILKFEEEEKSREELKERLEKEEKLKQKIFNHRKELLEEKGFEFDHTNTFVGFGTSITKEQVLGQDELEWYETMEIIKKYIEKHNKSELDKQKKDILDSIENWNDLISVFEGLGGDSKPFRLRKGEVPTEEGVDRLKKATKTLQEKVRGVRLAQIKTDLEPFLADVSAFMTVFDGSIEEREFNTKEARELMISFSKRMESVVNEYFGGIINS